MEYYYSKKRYHYAKDLSMVVLFLFIYETVLHIYTEKTVLLK